MNASLRQMVFVLLLTQLLGCCSCTDDKLPVSDNPQDETPAETTYPDAYQEKIRTQPYPKADNELFLNPPPLIVPQAMKTDDRLQFSLSSSRDFDSPDTFITEPQEWCMYNLHRQLAIGTWYWRFRSVPADGSSTAAWSDTYSFEVKEETPVFITPGFGSFLENAPRVHPRLYCFLNGRIDEARQNAASHPEYAMLQARASMAMTQEYTDAAALYANAETLRLNVTYLYHAYYLTQQENYAYQLRQLLAFMAANPPADDVLFSSNFTATGIALAHAAIYDLLYNRLTTDERAAAETLMMRVARYYYRVNYGYQENHIFDNHFWQQNLRILFQSAFLLYDKAGYSAEVLPMLEYYYELWTARAPATGFNRDGLWHNGTGYFTANVKTLAYMPALLSYVSRKDFLQHPWYQNTGRALVYSFPPQSKSNGFGDNSEQGDTPNRLVAAFADFMARETGDGYAGWYAGQCSELLKQDVELRLYRMCANRDYDTSLPADAARMVWYKDAGEVAMHSDPGRTDRNLALSFRSSTFGSGSHTTASQNAFNLLYKGADVYRSSGYYQNFADAHNLMSYRHTRAHNTILVNGIGQPYSTKGYGSIVRAMGGEHISYALGDASHAYCGISDDPMWIEYFRQAGISQTPENGFGTTPLSKYRRHVLMLNPDRIVVTYDELEATEPVDWEWLLHSPMPFQIDPVQQMSGTANREKGFIAVAQLFCSDDLVLSQTDRFVVPPAVTGPEYPDQWHLTATVSGRPSTRILAVIQVGDDTEGTSVVRRDGDTFRVGDWSITAVLDTDDAPGLSVRWQNGPASFLYDGLSVLYDEIDGEYRTVEMDDLQPVLTRTAMP